VGAPTLETWRYVDACVGVDRSIEELMAYVHGEALKRAGELPFWYANDFAYSNWAKVEILRWYVECPEETGNLSDEEVIASFCPEQLSWGKCFAGLDPRDFSSTTPPDEALRLADLACYSASGSSRVSAAKAVENFGLLAGALEEPSSEQTALFDSTITMAGLGGKAVAQAYALVTAATYSLSCIARQAE
jgi:hypothetical protein